MHSDSQKRLRQLYIYCQDLNHSPLTNIKTYRDAAAAKKTDKSHDMTMARDLEM